MPVAVRARPPAPGRLASHRRIDRGGGLPMFVRLVLVVAVVVLGAGVLYVGAGGLSRVAGTVGSSLTGFMDDLVATPTPAPSVISISDSPQIEMPEEPYTSETSADLVVIVPATLVGDSEHRIRVYLALKDQEAVAIGEWPIGPTQRTVIPVDLEKGINEFSVSVVGPGGESEASPLVRYVLDTSKPKITITSPKKNANINRKAVEIKGKTQGRATLIARNEANDSSVPGVAEADGTFTLSLPLASGSNVIRISSTDPAGNVGSAKLTVRRGSGELSVALGSSVYRIKRSSLPESIRLTATVTDPDGRALAGAKVTFTLSLPGIATVTRDGTTNGSGRAVFETTIPKAATRGQGLAAVLVKTSEFGSIDDRTVITITK